MPATAFPLAQFRLRHAGGLGAMLAALLLGGCGGGETIPPRYDLEGAVTFQGMPVPSGTISFNPTTGSLGGGFAVIENGRFNTRLNGRGHFGGPHTVSISGSDGQRIDPNVPDSGTKPLFPVYETVVELPKVPGNRDFEVPPAR